jgi:hypothetical protein
MLQGGFAGLADLYLGLAGLLFVKNFHPIPFADRTSPAAF